MNTNTVHTDVLVIGSGLAGLSAAWQAAQRGRSVALLTRAKDIHTSNTNLAQGGIIYRGRRESAEQLVEDVLAAGAGLMILRPGGIFSVAYLTLRLR